MAPAVYKICAVGRSAQGQPFVRYTGVPGIHVVNPNTQPQRIQLAFEDLMYKLKKAAEQFCRNKPQDTHKICVYLANKDHEISI